MKGDVRAPDASVVADTTVTLTSEAHTKPLTSETDEDGTFEFSKVPPGNYVLRVNLPGFQPVEMPVTVGSAPVPSIQVKLELAQVSEQVTVSAQSVVVATDNQSQAQIDEHLMLNLPARDADPLAVPSLFLNQAVAGANGPTLIVDGVETNSLDMPTSGVKSVVVDQNPYSAEFGRPGKGRLEVTTRHGAHRRYRGNFLALARNSALDARNALATERPLQQREIGEAELDGPLPFDKQTSFLVSGRYHFFNNSAVVDATTPPGILENNIPTPAGTFIENVRVPERRRFLFGRLDRQLSPGHKLSALYKYRDNKLENQGLGGVNRDLPDRATNVFQHENEGKILETATPSANFLNQVRLTFKDERQNTASISNQNAILIPGDANFGGAQVNQSVIEKMGDVQDVASVFHGRHNFQFGAGVKLRFFSSIDSSNFGGTFVFPSLTAFESTPPQPSEFKMNFGNPLVHFQQHEVFSFFQDQVRLLPNLSVMLGLRHEVQSDVSYYENFAPRFALAYSPAVDNIVLRDTVFRGGFGFFYDRLPYQMEQDSLLYNGVAIHQVVLSCPSACGTYPQPFPPGIQPSAATPSIMQIDPRIRMPYVMQGNFAIERKLGHHQNFLTFDFSTVRGVALYRMRNLNAPLPGSTIPPNSNFVDVNQFESYGYSRSNSLTVTYKGQIHKLNVMAQYVLSRSLDNTGGYMYIPADSYDPNGDWGRSDYDRRHRFNMVLVYPTKFGFRVSGIVNVWSGLPYNITTGTDDNSDHVYNDRPPEVWRNAGQAAPYADVDLRLSKRWRLWQKEHAHFVEVAWDAFNVFNHVNYQNYDGVLSSPAFGLPYTVNPARQLQVSVRYHF